MQHDSDSKTRRDQPSKEKGLPSRGSHPILHTPGKDYSIGLDLRRWILRTTRTLKRVFGLEKTVYVDQRRDQYRAYWEGAARILGADFVPLCEHVWEIRLGGCWTRVSDHVAQFDDPVTLRLAGDKHLALALAKEVEVPTADRVVFSLSHLAEARTFLSAIGGPCVVKPARGSSSGLGVTTHVTNGRELRRAAILASLICREILVERQVPGESYRLLFLDGVMIHAVRRRGVRVNGDGLHSLAQLVEALGLDVSFRDPVVRATLTAQGIGPDSVPEADRSVLVRSLPADVNRFEELRTVYDEDVTHLVGPALVAELRRVVDAIGSRFAGVDVVTTDPSVSLEESGGAFIELNTTPGIHHHYQSPEDDRLHPVTVRVLERLLEDRTMITRSRAPLPSTRRRLLAAPRG